MSSTQQVTIARFPHRLDWTMRGEVHGTGTLAIEYARTYTLSGPVSTNGGGDYYTTNATVTWRPAPGASGRLLVVLDFAPIP